MSTNANFNSLAIVGATGAVGREMVRLLDDHLTDVPDVRLFASSRSAGSRIALRSSDIPVETLTPDSLAGISLALFSAGTKVSLEYAPPAADAGTVVIDNSSAFRMRPDVPLVVPEVNAADLDGHHNLIANPNCSTIILVVALWPLHRAHPIERVVVSTYQAASGAGQSAMAELEHQTAEVLAAKSPKPQAFPHPCAFNLFSHNSLIDESGYNQEELKMVAETSKMFHDPDFRLTATCIRVPVLRAHSESVNITFRDPVSEETIREILHSAPGIQVVDDRATNHFPMPCEASGKDRVLVGRIRRDSSRPDGRGIELFLCGDQLLKGAALNAVQIAERVIA